MSKSEVETKCLSDYIIMPADQECLLRNGGKFWMLQLLLKSSILMNSMVTQENLHIQLIFGTFSPDLLFPKIAQSYNRSDVLSTEDLKDVSRYSDVVVDDGTIVCDWKSTLAKYSKLSGIRSLHDFIFALNTVTNTVVAKVRKNCYTGAFDNATIHMLTRRADESSIPDPVAENYTALGKLRSLSDSKLKNLPQMYKDFIPTDRYLPFFTSVTLHCTYNHYFLYI